jgi:hypothetical protein
MDKRAIARHNDYTTRFAGMLPTLHKGRLFIAMTRDRTITAGAPDVTDELNNALASLDTACTMLEARATPIEGNDGNE